MCGDYPATMRESARVPSRNRDVVREVIQNDGELRAADLIDRLATRTSLARPSIRGLLGRMVRDGELYRSSSGRYTAIA